MCSPRNLPGTGLLGEYFDVEVCRGKPFAVRNDAAIDFDAGFDNVDAAAGKRLRSVRWTGWIKAPFAGVYRFHFDAVDGRVVVSNQVCVQGGEPRGALEMHSGRFYPIALQLDRPLAPGHRIALEWTAPHGARYVVPKPLLFLPTESANS